MDLQLSRKIALVTAASSGLGRATALQLLQEGASVAVCSRSKEKLQEAYANVALDDKLKCFEANLLDKKSILKLIEEVTTHFGGLDILVTNMSGPPLLQFEQTQEEDWDEAYQALLKSAITLIKAALPALKKSQAASILTITSVAAKQIMPGLLLSNVYRPAIIGLTKALSKELGKYNIRINSILPGHTMTERLKQNIQRRAETQGISLQEETTKVTHHIALQRIGEPEEFAKAATFLVSPAASFITGAQLVVDGGFSDGIN